MLSQGERLVVKIRQAYMNIAPPWNPMEPPEDLDDSMNRLADQESDAESVHSDHATDSEQSGDDAECLGDDVEYATLLPMDLALGKDKETVWSLQPPHPSVHTRKHNIVSHLPEVKAMAKSAKTRIDCWKLFFPDAIIELIVKCTNKYLAKLRPNYGRPRDCRETDVGEILALLGILYMSGVKKAQHLNVKELWESDGTGVECFRATMSRQRFSLLMRALHFDDIDDQMERKKTDNLAPIRQVFEEFVRRCKDCYQVGEYVTIDEMLEAFRGKCKFRQFIANKPAKYGIKIYALADARMFYTYNLEIYSGKQPDGPYKLDNSVDAVVKRLAEPILNTGRNITMDNYFTSVPLALELLKCKTTIVGTLRKNKKEIPASFLDVSKRAPYSSRFGFLENGVLVSYKPTAKNKVVLVFSTLHDDNKIDEETGEVSKPEIITFYNLTKGAVDVVDEMKCLSSVSRMSSRWPLTVFFSLLNVGGINSQIIFKLNTEIVEDRRIFLKILALDLMKTHLLVKTSVSRFPMYKRKISFTQADEADVTVPDKMPLGRCYYCSKRKNRKTKKCCMRCKRFICCTHTTYLCFLCSKKKYK